MKIFSTNQKERFFYQGPPLKISQEVPRIGIMRSESYALIITECHTSNDPSFALGRCEWNRNGKLCALPWLSLNPKLPF